MKTKMSHKRRTKPKVKNKIDAIQRLLDLKTRPR